MEAVQQRKQKTQSWGMGSLHHPCGGRQWKSRWWEGVKTQGPHAEQAKQWQQEQWQGQLLEVRRRQLHLRALLRLRGVPLQQQLSTLAWTAAPQLKGVQQQQMTLYSRVLRQLKRTSSSRLQQPRLS